MSTLLIHEDMADSLKERAWEALAAYSEHTRRTERYPIDAAIENNLRRTMLNAVADWRKAIVSDARDN